MVIVLKIHYYFWQKFTLIRPFAAKHEHSCYCHIKQAWVITHNETNGKKKPLKKGKCYIGIVAMETAMCIRLKEGATDDSDLWAYACQMS